MNKWKNILLLLVFLVGQAHAEPPPLASDSPDPTDPSDFNDDEAGGEPPLDFGFAPPPVDDVPPPPQEPRSPTRPQSLQKNSFSKSGGSDANSGRSNFNSRPANSGPPARLNAPGSPPPSALGRNAGNTAQAPKLADYLELDPAVKGLKVQNFDLPDKDIRDVVTLISKWTSKNFILDNKVRGKITILGPSQVTLQEAYHAFLSALHANGLTTIQSGKFIRIIESAEARRSPVETYSGDYAPATDQFITRIFQLKYINADEVQREFRDLTTRQGKLFAYGPTNSIIITDTGSNIARIESILRTLDVKGFETTLHVLRIKHVAAKAISEMLEKIYDEDGGSSSRSTSSRRRRSSLSRTNSERNQGGGIISKIIPDDQTNSLVVLDNKQGVESLKRIISKLDVQTGENGTIHVYYCEYAKAEDLANTLAALASGTGRNTSGRSGSRRTSVTTGTNANRSRSTNAAASNAGSSGGSVTAQFGDDVKITADPPTNALVITASSAEFQQLKKVIRKLDIPRLQVFVETAILEVNLDGDTTFGSNLAAGVPGIGFGGGWIGSPSALANFITGGIPSEGLSAPLLAGSKFDATIAGQNVTVTSFMGLLNLLKKTTNTTVLSTPQIIALDNEEAEFKVQDEIPVQTSFTAGTAGQGGLAGAATGRIERLKTGIQIKLTPHVNAASRVVRLEIDQEVNSTKANSQVPTALQQVQRATTTRETNTSVVVKDGDYVMLGGLMSDKVDESTSKVPLLGDIPILGWLFKSKSVTSVKTNLVILLRPKIIGNSLQAADLVSEGLNSRDDFIERNMGGDDRLEEDAKTIRKRLSNQRVRGGGRPSYVVDPNADTEEDGDDKSDEPNLLIEQGAAINEE